MSLPHFFVDEPLDLDEHGPFILPLTRELSEHLRSARIRAGETIVLADGQGSGAEVVVEALSGMPRPLLEGRLQRTLLDRVGTQLTLIQGISKNDHMDQTIRQATELGLVRLIPLVCERTTVQLDDKGRVEKLQRWQRVARAASEQSGRLSLPRIEEAVGLEDALRLVAGYEGLIVCWEEAEGGSLGRIVEQIAATVFANPRVALFIGPEGGFSHEEVARMLQAGAQLASLGASILRTETAAVVASAIVLYHLGALGAD